MVYSRGVSSRSKLRIRYRKYVGLYRQTRRCTDQVTPALIEGTRQRRRERNIMETMSKRNYVIGVREPIGGDRSPRRYRNGNDEYPLPVVKRNGMGKSSEEKRSNRNITPRLHPKLWRRITYERRESEVDVRGDGRAGHVSDGDVVVIKVFERRVRARRGTRTGVAMADARVLGDHSAGTRRRYGARLG